MWDGLRKDWKVGEWSRVYSFLWEWRWCFMVFLKKFKKKGEVGVGAF